MTNPGAGQPIITDDGFIMTIIGFGHLTDKIVRVEAGGDRHLSYLYISATTFAGILCLTATDITTITAVIEETVRAAAIITIIQIRLRLRLLHRAETRVRSSFR